MSEWKEFTIEDFAVILNHKRIPLSSTERSKRKGQFPYYGASGIIDAVDDFIFDGEHVLVSEDGENLKSRQTPIAFLANGRFWVNNHAHILKGKKDFHNKLIVHYFANLDLNPFITGAVQPKLNKASLVSIPIYLPDDEEEQKSIVSILSSLDDKIDLLHRQNATLEKMAETLFKQWFVPACRDEHGAGREEAKEEWEEKTLEDILEFVVDNRGKTAPTSDSGIPLIATNCIKNNNIFPVYEKVRYVSQDTYDNWFRSHPKPGDIIFVNKGTPGCINLVPEPIDFCIAQDMIALRVDKNLVSNFYLFIYLRLETTQADIINSSVGTTIPHLKKTDLLKFTLPVPPIQLMNKFTQSVEPLFFKMNNNQTQIRTLTALRDTLLPKLMSGEIRVEM